MAHRLYISFFWFQSHAYAFHFSIFTIFIVVVKILQPELAKWIFVESPERRMVNSFSLPFHHLTHSIAWTISLSNFSNFNSFQSRRKMLSIQARIWMALNVCVNLYALCRGLYNIISLISYRVPIHQCINIVMAFIHGCGMADRRAFIILKSSWKV